jgi:hypothetical protein
MSKGYKTAVVTIMLGVKVDYRMTKGFPATYEGGQAVSPPEPPQAEIGRVWLSTITSTIPRWAQIYPDQETLERIEHEIYKIEEDGDAN